MSHPTICTYYYKDSIILRAYHNPKNYDRIFEYFDSRLTEWKSLPNNQILSLNMGKYIIEEQKLGFYLNKSYGSLFQAKVSKKVEPQ